MPDLRMRPSERERVPLSLLTFEWAFFKIVLALERNIWQWQQSRGGFRPIRLRAHHEHTPDPDFFA